MPGAALQVVRAFIAATLRGERPAWVPTGGSSALADVGFVSAAFELVEQIEAGVLPEPAEIFLPIGTGGTFAGLVLGAKLAGLRARIVGVLVTDILPPDPARLARLARATLALLRRYEPSLPTVEITPADFEVARAQLGPGYGATTPAAEAAVLASRDAGLTLETTYTAKCMAEVLARLADGRARTPVLFWNTYNSVDFWKNAPEPVAEDRLPHRIRRWLAEAPA